MGKRGLVWGVMGLFLLVLPVVALAGGVELATYEAGGATVGMISNTVGATVTGLHIEFDQEVTLVNKIEIGGYLPLLGEMTGTSFDFAGGELVAGGTVELDWEPAEATPVLIQWISGASPVGAPYFTTVQVMGRLLGEGIVAARENHPEQLQAAFAQFFADNAEFFASVSQSLGMPLEESLMPIIMAAPAEGIENFFNTLVGMLGVTSLDEVLQGDVNFAALFALLGL